MFYNGFQKYEDRFATEQFNYNERFFKISIDQQMGIFQLNLEDNSAKPIIIFTGFYSNSSFYTAKCQFLKNSKTSFNLFGSYGLTSRYLLKNQRQIYYGARITNRFTDNNYLSLFYQNNYIPEEYFKDRNLFEVLFISVFSATTIWISPDATPCSAESLGIKILYSPCAIHSE